MEVELFPRQVTTNGTVSPGDDQSSFSFAAWLASYWFILLIVLAVLVVVCVLICACVLKKHPRSHSFHPRSRAPKNSNSPDQGGSSEQSHQSSVPTMPSLSADSTPIPSPHSSQHSMVHYNGRNRRTSPHFSSTSSDTLRPDVRSESSNSSASLMGHSPTRQQDRGSPLERHGSLPRRTGPMVRVTSMPDVKNNGGLRPAPSTVSVESSSNGKSGVSYKFMPTNSSKTFVEVGVTVHTPGDPDKAVRIATAAALAESARKLAQEAASFIDNGEESISVTGPSPLSSRGGTRPYHPGSGRSSSFSLSQPSPYSTCHPLTTANLDNTTSATGRIDGDNLRGGHYPGSHYPLGPAHFQPRTTPMYVNEPEYEESLNYDDRFATQQSFHQVNPHYHRTHSLSFQRGRPHRSSLDNYRREDLHPLSTRDRVPSIRTQNRDSTFTRHNHTPTTPGAESLGFYSHSPGTQRLMESSYSKKIPFHLTAAGRRQSAPNMERRGTTLQQDSVRRFSVRNQPPSANRQHIKVPVEIEETIPHGTVTGGSSNVTSDGTKRKRSTNAQPSDITMPASVPPSSLPQSPSTSASLSSSGHSSQIERDSVTPTPCSPDHEFDLDDVDCNGGTDQTHSDTTHQTHSVATHRTHSDAANRTHSDSKTSQCAIKDDPKENDPTNHNVIRSIPSCDKELLTTQSSFDSEESTESSSLNYNPLNADRDIPKPKLPKTRTGVIPGTSLHNDSTPVTLQKNRKQSNKLPNHSHLPSPRSKPPSFHHPNGTTPGGPLPVTNAVDVTVIV